MRKQIGLRMKDETRDQLERVRGGLSRTDYIEGAVLAQIARDLKKTETPHEYSLDDGKPVIPDYDRAEYQRCLDRGTHSEKTETGQCVECGFAYYDFPLPQNDTQDVSVTVNMDYSRAEKLVIPERIGPLVRSSAESKSGVLPVPKKAQKGRK